MTDSKDPDVDYVIELVEGSEVTHWRVINNASIGKLISPNAEEGHYMLMIRMETVDTDGRNPMTVQFGLNPGAIESLVGSAGATLLDSDEAADAVVLFNVWSAMIQMMNSHGEEHHPDCPRRDDV